MAVPILARQRNRGGPPCCGSLDGSPAGANERGHEKNLAQQVLPMFRSRANLFRWDAVDRYCAQAWEGVGVLEQAREHEGAAAVVPVVQKALTAMGSVLLRADDSNGSISDVFCHLLELHAELCREAPPTTAKLIGWLITFQFGDGQDYVQPDPVNYAPALGGKPPGRGCRGVLVSAVARTPGRGRARCSPHAL